MVTITSPDGVHRTLLRSSLDVREGLRRQAEMRRSGAPVPSHSPASAAVPSYARVSKIDFSEAGVRGTIDVTLATDDDDIDW